MGKIVNSLVGAYMVLLPTQVIAQDSIPNGEAKYKQNCVVCHGDKGHGDGPAAAGLAHEPKNIASELNDIFELKYFLVRDVMKGKVKKGMPGFADTLTRQDVYDIFAYIESMQ